MGYGRQGHSKNRCQQAARLTKQIILKIKLKVPQTQEVETEERGTPFFTEGQIYIEKENIT